MRCEAKKRDGSPCKMLAMDGTTLCWAHTPEHAARRKENTSNAGKVKPVTEITKIKKRIRDLADDVVSGKVDKGAASVAFQGLGVLKGYIELERKIRETEELATELAELQELVESRNAESGRRWG